MSVSNLCRSGPAVTVRPGGGVVCVLQLRPGNEVYTDGDPEDEEDGKDLRRKEDEEGWRRKKKEEEGVLVHVVRGL